MSEQDVFGFQIAMDDTLALKKNERRENLFGESLDKDKRKALEFMCFDELIEVDPKQFGGNAQVAAEVEGLREVNHAVFVLRILYDTVSICS